MKKILKGLFVLLFLFILSGCTKDYKPITYTKFIETFRTEMDYVINDGTSSFDDRFERYDFQHKEKILADLLSASLYIISFLTVSTSFLSFEES